MHAKKSNEMFSVQSKKQEIKLKNTGKIIRNDMEKLQRTSIN